MGSGILSIPSFNTLTGVVTIRPLLGFEAWIVGAIFHCHLQELHRCGLQKSYLTGIAYGTPEDTQDQCWRCTTADSSSVHFFRTRAASQLFWMRHTGGHYRSNNTSTRGGVPSGMKAQYYCKIVLRRCPGSLFR